MLRRSDFIAATYALSFVFANFGIAIAARMPMMTTTIKSSIRVKPFLLLILRLPKAIGLADASAFREKTRTSAVGNGETRQIANAAHNLSGCGIRSYGARDLPAFWDSPRFATFRANSSRIPFLFIRRRELVARVYDDRYVCRHDIWMPSLTYPFSSRSSLASASPSC